VGYRDGERRGAVERIGMLKQERIHMSRPTFFISSTIYDFSDLRSALKFYLEEQGCKVLASDYNDFEKKLDSHSYEACIEAIHNADYFILLIGTRVGGWYDKIKRISITQKEYREAYELQKSGKIKLLNFVRADVWNTKEDRRELAKFLEGQEIDEQKKRDIVNYKSKFADDAAFLTSFINEVGKNAETQLAVSEGVKPPVGNWIHVFTGFKDIIDAVEGHIFSSTPIADQAVRRLLRIELRDFLKRSLMKSKGNAPYSPRYAVEKFNEKYPIDLSTKLEGDIEVEKKSWIQLFWLAFSVSSLRFHPVVLPQVLTMSTFLEYDLECDSYVETEIYGALRRLQDEIRSLTEFNTDDCRNVILKNLSNANKASGATIKIELLKLVLFLGLLNRWINVIELLKCLLHYLERGVFLQPKLRSSSPIQGMQEQIDQETVTDEDVDGFLEQD
jgi:hypothetical protein